MPVQNYGLFWKTWSSVYHVFTVTWGYRQHHHTQRSSELTVTLGRAQDEREEDYD